mmetsp:Transcript_75980/g.211016  ORF Transcript_75980/g.211016 Transcript_75980/m.211016 type:complete len:363 (+) Transcript_75980:73-1161(+)
MGRMFAVLVFVLCDLPMLRARLGNTVVELKGRSFDAFVQENERVMVDFYDATDSDWPAHEQELMIALRGLRSNGVKVPLAKVDVKEEEGLAKRFVSNGRYPQLLWFLHGKPTQYHRTFRKAQAIEDFVVALDRPAIVSIPTRERVSDYNRAVLAEIPRRSPAYKVLEVIAQKHMDTIAFTLLESEAGTISFHEWRKDPVKYTGGTNEKDLEAWIKDQLPFKTEAVPTEDARRDGHSLVVVGKTFEELVLRDDKDVFLLVHAPWCGYCKKLSPAWEKLGTMLAPLGNIEVAKLDGDRNDSPLPNDFSWTAFPTIFYVRAGEKVPVIYSGNRTFEDLMDFAKSHSTKPLNFNVPDISTDSIFDL